MESFAELLEEELAEAVEIKNRKSLHRYIVLLTQQHVDQHTHETQYRELRNDLKAAIQAMQAGFDRMDERFTAQQKQIDERFSAQQKQIDERFTIQQKQIDERFSAQQKQIDERFTAQDRRFEDQNQRFQALHKLITIGFTALALIIAAFNAALLFGM